MKPPKGSAGGRAGRSSPAFRKAEHRRQRPVPLQPHARHASGARTANSSPAARIDDLECAYTSAARVYRAPSRAQSTSTLLAVYRQRRGRQRHQAGRGFYPSRATCWLANRLRAGRRTRVPSAARRLRPASWFPPTTRTPCIRTIPRNTTSAIARL